MVWYTTHKNTNNTKETKVMDSNIEECRKKALDRLAQDLTEENLWRVLELFAGESFKTAKGLEYTYFIKGNEIFFSRKEKSITRSTTNIAFKKALELNGIVKGPKKLGVFGASYIYPIFIRIGVINKTGNENNQKGETDLS